MSSPRCPRCGFRFAWDGRVCAHCPLPARARQLWNQSTNLAELLNPTLPAAERPLLALAAGCLRRAWDVLPAAARTVTEDLESGARGPELAAAVDALGSDSALRPESARVARTAAGAIASGSSVELVRAIHALAAECRRLVGVARFPDRPRDSFPLPPGLERYRKAASDLARAGEIFRQELGLRSPDDPVRLTVEHLDRESLAHWQQRHRATKAEEAGQCDVFRDVFGYPDAQIAFDPRWRTSTVVALARAMHASGDFSAMPILADALQDDGCEEPEVLEHCRAEETHTRGCWVLTAILGRE